MWCISHGTYRFTIVKIGDIDFLLDNLLIVILPCIRLWRNRSVQKASYPALHFFPTYLRYESCLLFNPLSSLKRRTKNEPRLRCA